MNSNKYLPLHIPETLPCYPCPHNARCCTQGTALTETEAGHLATTFGPETVTLLTPQEIVARGWFDQEEVGNLTGLWATTVDPHTQRCALYRNHGCIAYHHPHYPVVCRAYPHTDPLDNTIPQASDAQLCPEITQHKPPPP